MIRWSTAVVVVILAGIAAVISYRHGLAVVEHYGQSQLNAVLTPITVDGMVFVSSMVLLDAARRDLRTPRLAGWTLALGIAATLTTNVLDGLSGGPVGAVIAGWPAAALVLSYELLMGLIRRSADPTQGSDLRDQDVQVFETEHLAEPVYDWHDSGDFPAVVELTEELRTRAASVFLGEVMLGEVPGVRRIKDQLGVGQDKARSVRAYLEGLAAA